MFDTLITNLKETLLSKLVHQSTKKAISSATTDDLIRDYSRNIHNQYLDKYPDLKIIELAMQNNQTNLNEFQSNINLAKNLVTTKYGITILNYMNAQCQTRRQYRLDAKWSNKSDNIVKKLLEKYQGEYTIDPIDTFKNQLLPQLNQSLDDLANTEPFKNNQQIKTYQNRIDHIKTVDTKDLSLKFIQGGYEQTLIELANDDFDEYDIVKMWNQQVQNTFDNIDDFKTKLILIAFNIETIEVTNFVTHEVIDEFNAFKSNIELVTKLKQLKTHKTEIEQITNNFNADYKLYKKQSAENKRNGEHPDYNLKGTLQSETLYRTYNVYADANKLLSTDIEKYLISHPIDSPDPTTTQKD